MATGHLNPGHGNIVTTLQRARIAQMNNYDAGGQNLKSLETVRNKSNLDEIRHQARETWMKRDANETSYQDHFKDRFVEVGEFQRTRPSSGGRKNKPHPSMVFLTNRLHHVPGYHNADTTLAKDPYRIDDSMTPNGKATRDKFKEKFTPRPCSAAVNQYKTDTELEDLVANPYDRQAYEAAIKITNERENVIGKLREIDSRNGYQSRGALERSYRPRTVPSLHRYLRHAGARESDQINRLYFKRVLGEETYFGLPKPTDVITQRFDDIDKTKNVTLRNFQRTKRGDFLMHPEWPPNFTAHRLNGLSSVDGQWAHRR